MRFIQLTPSLSYGDAVSNDIIAMAAVLTDLGIDNLIVCLNHTQKVKHYVTPFEKYKFQRGDIALYHMSIGSILTEFVMKTPFKKRLMVYHNITPAHFFKETDQHFAFCNEGRNQLKSLANVIDFSMADSDFNRQELEDFGFKNTVTLPIILNFDDYKNVAPSKKILDKYDDSDIVNILFVGRIAPNKKHDDVISAFHAYNKYINPRSRLFLVGSSGGFESYERLLKNFIADNNIRNVFFSGHVCFSEIVGYYKVSDVFLCMSEHEGFCVPLVEAMVFDVPIVAYAESAVPYTMGSSGVLIAEKNPHLTAEIINLLISNTQLRQQVVKSQIERLADFDEKKVGKQFADFILPFAEKEPK